MTRNNGECEDEKRMSEQDANGEKEIHTQREKERESGVCCENASVIDVEATACGKSGQDMYMCLCFFVSFSFPPLSPYPPLFSRAYT